MLQTRIREIRKAKKLTLADVGERAGTTAQTIGRLETGMRTLSIKWVNRIAAALEVDPGELLVMPENGDIQISGLLLNDGLIESKDAGTIGLRFNTSHPVAIRVAANFDGTFFEGDTIICDLLDEATWESALNQNCLVELADGSRTFARITAVNAGKVDFLPLARGASMVTEAKVNHLAKACMLVRPL